MSELVGKTYVDGNRKPVTVIAVDDESSLVETIIGLRVVQTSLLRSVLEIQSGELTGRYLAGLSKHASRRERVTVRYRKAAVGSTDFEEGDSTALYELDGDTAPDSDPREDLWETLCDTEDTQTIEQTIAGLRDVTPPYPMCSGYPTKADCARRGYCAREITCDN